MKTKVHVIALVSALMTAGCASSTTPIKEGVAAVSPTSEWQTEFGVAKRNLVATGRNPYFILEHPLDQQGVRLAHSAGKQEEHPADDGGVLAIHPSIGAGRAFLPSTLSQPPGYSARG